VKQAMADYHITVKASVEKDIRKIPTDITARIFEHIESLLADPFPKDSRKLTGAEHLYRIRVGDYRVIYEVILDDKEITILYIRHRSSAYRNI
jgi:mRNA interferase RelE/StbE